MNKRLVIDAELHRQLKTKAASEGKQIKEVIEALIKDYLKVLVSDPEETGKRKYIYEKVPNIKREE